MRSSEPLLLGASSKSHRAQQRTQRPLRDRLRVEYAIEKPSNKPLAVAELDPDCSREMDSWIGGLMV